MSKSDVDMKPKYSSYEDIRRDLQILKVERELNFHKIFRSVDQIKEEFHPYRLAINTFGSLSSTIKNSGGIQAFIITSVLKFIFKRFKK